MNFKEELIKQIINITSENDSIITEFEKKIKMDLDNLSIEEKIQLYSSLIKLKSNFLLSLVEKEKKLNE